LKKAVEDSNVFV